MFALRSVLAAVLPAGESTAGPDVAVCLYKPLCVCLCVYADHPFTCVLCVFPVKTMHVSSWAVVQQSWKVAAQEAPFLLSHPFPAALAAVNSTTLSATYKCFFLSSKPDCTFLTGWPRLSP